MITTLALAAFVITAACATVRLFRGPTLADRVMALDVVLISLMGAIVVDGAVTGTGANLELLVVIAIVGFTATLAASRFIEREDVLP